MKKFIELFYNQLFSTNTKNSRTKINELIDLGKFLNQMELLANDKIELVECDDKMIPDFFVKSKRELIGIEHTSLIDKEVVEEISELQKVMLKAQEILLNDNHSINGLYNVFLSGDKRLMFQKDLDNYGNNVKKTFWEKRNSMPALIADYIYSLYTGDKIE